MGDKMAGGRDVAIDVVRGYCIASMVTAHVAGGHVIASALHAPPVFDGASGFILLSGLILGMVQNSRLSRDGLHSVQVKTLRRTLLIVWAQFFLIVLSAGAAYVSARMHANLIPLGTGPRELALGIATLQLAPPAGSVLRLYVVMMLLGLVAFWLLSRDRWMWTLSLSATLWATGQIAPEATSFYGIDGQRGASWAGWQALFVFALVLGWNWRSLEVKEKLRRSKTALAAPTVFAIALLAGSAYALPEWWSNKLTLGPIRFAMAFLVAMLLYIVSTALTETRARILLRPVATIGARSLDAYIIQAAVMISVPSFAAYSRGSQVSMLIAFATLATCWYWATLRQRYGGGPLTFITAQFRSTPIGPWWSNARPPHSRGHDCAGRGDRAAEETPTTDHPRE